MAGEWGCPAWDELLMVLATLRGQLVPSEALLQVPWVLLVSQVSWVLWVSQMSPVLPELLVSWVLQCHGVSGAAAVAGVVGATAVADAACGGGGPKV